MATFVRNQEIEHEIGTTGTFALRLTSGEVELRAVDGDTARVRASFELRAASDADADELFERVRLRAGQSPGLLEVSEPRRGSPAAVDTIARILRFGADVAEVRLEADVPRGAHLRFDGVSAEVVARGFAGTQHYRTVSGDLVLNESSGDVRLRGVSSDISVRAKGDLDLEVNTVSGDLSVVAPRYGQLHVTTVSGDVELEGELAVGPAHRVETVSGDLWLGLLGGLTLQVRGLSTDVDATLPHRAEGSRDRRRYIVGRGEATLDFSSMSGDVSIHAARRTTGRTAEQALPQPPAVAPEAQLEILHALERGEIDVDEATRRLGGG